MDFITNSEHSEMIVNSLSSVKSQCESKATTKQSGGIGMLLISDGILDKLYEVTRNTNLMKGGFKKESETESEEEESEVSLPELTGGDDKTETIESANSDKSDKSDKSESVSSLSSTTSTPLASIQSGGAKKKRKPKTYKRKIKSKTKSKTKPKIKV